MVDTRDNGQVYKLLVDIDNGRIEEDISALTNAEALAYQFEHGKLQRSLHEHLLLLPDDAMVSVAVWMFPKEGKTLVSLQDMAFSRLIDKYPEAQLAVEKSGKPMDVANPELAKMIEKEYQEFLISEMAARTQNLVLDLRNQGYSITLIAGMPSFAAYLPKSVILEISNREDVGNIYLIEKTFTSELDAAIPNAFASNVWAKGIIGSRVTVAVLENGNIDPGNTFLNHATSFRLGGGGVQDHATLVASNIASFHSYYRGMAYGAIVSSAGHDNSQSDSILALQWAINQGAKIVNHSGGFEADNIMNWTDRAFDYWTRSSFRLAVKSAGNTGGSITSPGKAWNVLTVGAYDDKNNTDWADDKMWIGSSFSNPASPQNDREKPEIVAVGSNITGLAMANAIQTATGTSLAAPQVAGLAALLINRNSQLYFWPESARAIIMASATHNIEGPTNIVSGQGDLKDGAGAVNADFADQIAQFRGTASGTCYASCWWGESIDNIGFPIYTDKTYYFFLNDKSFVRIAIAWWSNADAPTNNYSFSRLDTDLDLRVKGPNGQYLSGVNSLSFDNNYEIVEFFGYAPGQYQIVIHKTRADESSNYVGTSALIISMPNSAFMPLVMK